MATDDELHATLTRTCELVLADIVHERRDAGQWAVDVRQTRPDRPLELPWTVEFSRVDRPGGFWFGLDICGSRLETQCALVDMIQDEFMGGEIMAVVPACRHADHGHPLQPQVRDGAVVWACPEDDAMWFPLGDLQ